MEPFCLIGVCPLGWGAGWAVTREMGVWFREAETESEIVVLEPQS